MHEIYFDKNANGARWNTVTAEIGNTSYFKPKLLASTHQGTVSSRNCHDQLEFQFKEKTMNK